MLEKGFVKLIPDSIEEFTHNYKNETEEIAKRIQQLYIEPR